MLVRLHVYSHFPEVSIKLVVIFSCAQFKINIDFNTQPYDIFDLPLSLMKEMIRMIFLNFLMNNKI